MTLSDSFSNYRYNYYISGRLLFFSTLPQTGAILLGYAIESFLKAGLSILKNKNKRLENSHNLIWLFDECRKLGIYNEIKTSHDFIEYANDMLNQRYPSQSAATHVKTNIHNQSINFKLEFLTSYDDLICQLDDTLALFVEDVWSSIGVKAATQLAQINKGRLFFHCNAFALSRFPSYRDKILKNGVRAKIIIGPLENNVDTLWHSPEISADIGIKPEDILQNYTALKFKYPKSDTSFEITNLTHKKN
jgi:hypothetical protein